MKKILVLTLFTLISCSHTPEKEKAPLESKGEYLVGASLWVQKSPEFKAMFYQSYDLAKRNLEEELKKKTKKPLAVILDIDETVLDNSPFEGECARRGISFDKALWIEWVSMAKAKALPGVKDFLDFASKKNVEIFYVSNRDVGGELLDTYKNLINEKLPVKKDNLLFREKGENGKEKRRELVLKKYKVALYLGDNLSDFSSDFDALDSSERENAVFKHRTKFGKTFIILPNPMYGDWMKPFIKEKKTFRDILDPMK